MKILVRNNTDLPKRYAGFIRSRIRKAKEKFQHLLYAEVYLSKEGNSNAEYKSVVKLGVGGQDIVLTNTSTNPTELWRKTFEDVQRYLRKYKKRHRTPQIAMSLS